MQKIRGIVAEMTDPYTINTVAGWTIDRIRIGDRTLKGVKIDDAMVPHLRETVGRDVCFYVLGLPGGVLPVSLTPNLFGMRDTATGEKHVIPFAFARNSFIRYLVIPALVWSIFGAIVAAIVATVLGFLGVENPMILAALPGFAFFGGWFLAWGCAVVLAVTYLRVRID